MNKNNFVVLRAPSAQNRLNKQQMDNVGVGFVDSVITKQGQQRSVVHMLPEQPMKKGQTVMIFPAKGRELPVELTNHTDPSSKQNRTPGFVLYQQDRPVGSGWLHIGKRAFLVVKVNRELVDDDKRLTLFPRFVQPSTSQPRAQQPAKPAPNTTEAWEAALAKNGFVLSR